MLVKTGDVFIDIAKIVFAVAGLTPFVKNGSLDNQAILLSLLMLTLGLYTYYKRNLTPNNFISLDYLFCNN